MLEYLFTVFERFGRNEYKLDEGLIDHCCMAGKLDHLIRLIKQGCPVSPEALSHACENGHLEV
jgi:hypothetical protein